MPVMSIFTGEERAAVVASQPVPLYHQLYCVLRLKIEQGGLRHGEVLPSELELAELFGVSRITSKRALDELERAGMVSRRRGQGTTITHRYEPKMLVAPLTSMLESLAVMGKETTVELVEFERVVAPDTICTTLKLPPRSRVDRAVRLRFIDGDPFAHYVSFTIPLGSTFNAKALRQGSRLELFRAMGVEVGEIDQVLSACGADAFVAKALNLTVGAPLLQVNRTYFDVRQRPVDHLHCRYRPDRFQYHMRLSAPLRGSR